MSEHLSSQIGVFRFLLLGHRPTCQGLKKNIIDIIFFLQDTSYLHYKASKDHFQKYSEMGEGGMSKNLLWCLFKFMYIYLINIILLENLDFIS